MIKSLLKIKLKDQICNLTYILIFFILKILNIIFIINNSPSTYINVNKIDKNECPQPHPIGIPTLVGQEINYLVPLSLRDERI